MAKKPKGNRAIYQVKIGGRNVYSRLKTSTGDAFGLKATTDIQQNKSAVVRGAKGTKSYTLYFKDKTSVGGVSVWSVDFPVDGKVKLKPMMAFAKTLSGIVGLRTPWGISYYWDKTNRSGGSGGGGGLPNLPNLPSLPPGAGGALGNYLQKI